MTTGTFSPAELKQLIHAPHLIRHLLTIADRGGILTKRGESKALSEFLSKYQSKSALVQSIIAGQVDAPEKIEASAEEAQKMLEQVGSLIEAKTGEADGDAVRDFLMAAGEAVAKAVREQSMVAGAGASPAEQKALTAIAGALKATEADKSRRYAAANKKAEEQAKAKAEARKQAEEAKAKAEAHRPTTQAKPTVETHKPATQVKPKAEAQKPAAQAQPQFATGVPKEVAEAQAKAEAQKPVEEAPAQFATEVPKQVAEAQAKAEAPKPAAEAPKEAEVEIYVVKPGDTLSGISKMVYGKAGRWKEIFEANRDIIQKPNLIRPGWKLRIPR